MSRRPSRRGFLATAGALALGGCLSGGPDDTVTPLDTTTPTDTTPTADPPSSLDGAWPAPAHDAGRSNGTTAAGPTEPVAELWTAPTDAALSSPVVADETLYVGGRDGTVRAFDARTGAPGWTRSVGSSADAPRLRAGTAFVPTETGLVALAAADGTERWRVETPDRTAVTVADHGIYWLRDGDPGTVVALDADGSERWQTTLGDPWQPPLFAGPDRVFVSSGPYDVRFWLLDPATGEIRGETPRRGADFPDEQYYRDGTVYAVDAFFGSVNTRAVADDGDDWTQDVPPGGGVGAMSGTEAVSYYVANADGEPNVTAMSARDGSVAWTADFDAAVAGRPAAASETAVVPTDGGLRCLDAADGSDRFVVPLRTERVALVDDLVYATADATVRAFRPP